MRLRPRGDALQALVRQAQGGAREAPGGAGLSSRAERGHPAFPPGSDREIGRNFLLVPGDEAVHPGHRIPIRLSRGRAFGSGLHETTVSCIEAMEGLCPAGGGTVLDVGAGTGILALAALLLGAGRAVALDIDLEAAEVCRRNAALNGLSEKMAVYCGTLDALGRGHGFDLVTANIHGDIICRAAGRLAGCVRESGHLILSGIDYSDSRAVRTSMEKEGMEGVSVSFLDDYVTQLWRRPPGTG